MNSINFDYEQSCHISKEILDLLEEQLQPEIERITNSRTYDYNTDYASINLPFDKALIKTIQCSVKEKKSLQPTTLVVIGIGGSNLGTIAILEGLRGKFYNEHYTINVYFLD